jgi:peroxiredoxin
LNKLKSIFVMPFMGASVMMGLYALYQLIWNGWSLGYMGVILTTLPFPAYLMFATMVKPVARTSNRLPLVMGFGVLGMTMAVFSYATAPVANLGPLAMAIIGMTGFFLYNYWYSSFGGRNSAQLKIGSPLPALTLQTTDGEDVSTSSLLGKPTIFLFYRGNWCPLCMAQIQEIADDYKSLADRGAQIALISPQSHDNTQELATRFDVPFLFFVDHENRAAKALDIVMTDGVPLGITGYDPDTVMPTVIITDATGRIIFLDQTDNYRVRPEPSTFIAALESATT